ncbi:hypothetical protein [Arcticibacter tournemirensis]|uniref:Uncharacterized protein n=1 Tax=Arcticibacter tournemirensis TaxID=699437 RepID=A0A4Q0M874_9SPHI|nr:hypothetical protein [Arcticibacter tournemirensis]RXF69093.1 hypothetical protein EKH83_13135 [Arcticibacter tournemirensis]
MVHLIITSANIEEYYIKRKQQYIDSIEACLKYTSLFDSYTILECTSPNEEYLNNYNVFYSQEGNPYLNKGLNEMNHLRSFINTVSFSPNDIIIKLSGRYLIQSSHFFQQATMMNDKYDCIFKDDSDVYEGLGYHTFLYAIKTWLLLETINSLNFDKQNNRPIEWDVKTFIEARGRNMLISDLDLIAYQGTCSDLIYRC